MLGAVPGCFGPFLDRGLPSATRWASSWGAWWRSWEGGYCRVSGLITCFCCLYVVVSCAWFVLTARHVRCLLCCFPALLVLCSLAHLIPHLVLIISLASLYSSLCFSVFCQCCGFSRLHWLYYSPLVLSCQAPVLVAAFVFLCTSSVCPDTVGFPRHPPFRVICGLAVDCSASRSD